MSIHTENQMVILLSALENFGANTWNMFLICVQGEYDSQQPEEKALWFKFLWGAVKSQMGSAKCVVGYVLPVHLLP